MAEEVARFTVSLPFDRALAEDDLTGSRAHVQGLGKSGILSDEEVATLLGALDRVGEELTSGTFEFEPGDEDVHTAVERRVTELAGDVGAKIHTGPEPQRPDRHRSPALVSPVATSGGRRRAGPPRRPAPTGRGGR